MLVDSSQNNIPFGTTANMFLGRPIEFIGAPSIARLLMTADGAGFIVTWLINVGGVQSVPIASGTTVNTSFGPGSGPKEDEDQMVTNVPLPAGSRNQLNVSNTNTAAPTDPRLDNVRYRATILP